MKKYSCFIQFQTIACICAGLIAPIKAKSADLVLAADPWCPFTCEEGRQKNGFMVEVAQLLLREAGHQVNYKAVPWTRAVAEARENRYTAIVGALKSDAPDFIFPLEPLAEQESCFFVRKGDPYKYEGPKSLQGIRLGAVKDYSYGEVFDEFIKKNTGSIKEQVQLITGTDTAYRLMQMLLHNRVDVIIEDKSVVSYNLLAHTEIDSSKLESVGCLKSAPLYVAFSPKNPQSKTFAEAFSKNLKKLRKSDELKAIYEKYGLKVK